MRKNPRNEDLWRRLAECLLEEGHYRAAVRVANFMSPSYKAKDLLVRVVANAMAGRKREAYQAASQLVRNFPDCAQHWSLLQWTCLATEKRHVRISKSVPTDSDWHEFAQNVDTLDKVLRTGEWYLLK